jgi:hypothetical protein
MAKSKNQEFPQEIPAKGIKKARNENEAIHYQFEKERGIEQLPMITMRTKSANAHFLKSKIYGQLIILLSTLTSGDKMLRHI